MHRLSHESTTCSLLRTCRAGVVGPQLCRPGRRSWMPDFSAPTVPVLAAWIDKYRGRRTLPRNTTVGPRAGQQRDGYSQRRETGVGHRTSLIEAPTPAAHSQHPNKRSATHMSVGQSGATAPARTTELWRRAQRSSSHWHSYCRSLWTCIGPEKVEGGEARQKGGTDANTRTGTTEWVRDTPHGAKPMRPRSHH